MQRVSFEQMHSELVRVLLSVGFQPERAELCAELFAGASRDGVYSHGLNRFPAFIKGIKAGFIDVEATPSRIDGAGMLERWDGHLGPGNLNAHQSMQRAIALAREHGIGCVGLNNTNHWMRGGSYGWQAAEAGVIGICWTNTMPNLPPWGSKEARVGNNPLVVAIPRSEGHVVLDMAMSQFSYGKLETYRRADRELPMAGGFNKSGQLTTNPAAIEETGRVLPIGYWKGSGLALVLDIMASVLSGGDATYQIGQKSTERGLSQVFLALEPGRSAVSDAQVNDIIEYTRQAEPSESGQRVYYPGEQTLLRRRENLEKGIPVDPEYWDEVLAM